MTDGDTNPPGIPFWTAEGTARAVRNREVSVEEVVTAHLEQAHRLNPKINALPVIDDSALDRAREMDGLPDDARGGALFGVPVTTKINTDQIGFANSNGVPAFADVICTSDAPVVANLKSSGAVIIGRTNTPEFSLRWFTSNPLHGATLNPWNINLTPGGSSGGASAAVAAGIGSLAHGNDLGGSLRYPAYCCGLATLRPSTGRVPAFNESIGGERPPMTQMMSVQGPIARTIADVRLGLSAMSAADSSDPMWRPVSPTNRPLDATPVIGICVDGFDTEPSQDVAAALAEARAALTDGGYKIVEVTPPDLNRAAELWGRLLYTEIDILSGDTMRAVSSPELNTLFDVCNDAFGILDFADYLRAMQQRHTIQRLWTQMFEGIDILLMPVSLRPPFQNDEDFASAQSLLDILDAQRPLMVVNLLGLPAAAVPTSVSGSAPLGVQLVGPMGEDDFVLSVAQKLEDQIGRMPPPPMAL